MYESPITIVTQKLRKAISEQYDNHIMTTVEGALGCEVDKEELIKALNYDRSQYDKGFLDGMVCGSTVYVVKSYWEPKPNRYQDPDDEGWDIDNIFATRELALNYIRLIAERYEERAKDNKVDFIYHFEENEDDEYGPMDPGMHQQVTYSIKKYEVIGDLNDDK